MQEEQNSGIIELGGEIVLSGFARLDPGEMIIAKKIIGTHVKHFMDVAKYKSLKIVLKMHDKDKGALHEINAELGLEDGKLNGEAEERNLFSAINSALEKVSNQLEHKK